MFAKIVFRLPVALLILCNAPVSNTKAANACREAERKPVIVELSPPRDVPHARSPMSYCRSWKRNSPSPEPRSFQWKCTWIIGIMMGGTIHILLRNGRKDRPFIGPSLTRRNIRRR